MHKSNFIVENKKLIKVEFLPFVGGEVVGACDYFFDDAEHGKQGY